MCTCESDKAITISKKSNITIGLLLVILTSLGIGEYHIITMLNRQKTTELALLQHINNDRWTLSHMTIYSSRLAEHNPKLKVPQPLDIERVLNPILRKVK